MKNDGSSSNPPSRSRFARATALATRVARGSPFCAGALALALASPAVHAMPEGTSGASGQQGADCSGCHAGGPTRVRFVGTTTLTAGQIGEFTFIVSAGGGTTGLDVSASTGVELRAGPNTRLLNGEVTHAAPVPAVGGEVAFSFSVVAPATTGTITLYGAGLAANGDGTRQGDQNGTATHLIQVLPPGERPDAGSSNGTRVPLPPQNSDAGAAEPSEDADGGPARPPSGGTGAGNGTGTGNGTGAGNGTGGGLGNGTGPGADSNSDRPTGEIQGQSAVSCADVAPGGAGSGFALALLLGAASLLRARRARARAAALHPPLE